MLTFITFVLVFGTIVFFHEFGHFAVAKLAGIRVEEFALGFGPPLASKKMGETKYSLRAFPLGGFVRLAGMDEMVLEDEQDAKKVDSAEEPAHDGGSFQNKSLPWRLATIAAGPLMNFVLAIVLFTLFFMFITLPPKISHVEPASPAEIAGFLPGDEFVSVNGEEVNDTERIIDLIKMSPGQQMAIGIKRQDRFTTLLVTPQDDQGEGRIGVAIEFAKPRYPFLLSARAAVSRTWAVTAQLVGDLSRMITGKQKADISGPIGIVQLVGETARQGIGEVLFLAILLNINLGLLNLLPIPVLDGGWLVILVVEAVRGKPLSAEARGIVQFIGLALLVLLMIFATFKDIARFNFFS